MTVQAEVAVPTVIVTNRELALINAIKLVFPEAKHMPCEWHINIDVLAHGRKEKALIVEEDSETVFRSYGLTNV